MAQTNGAIKSEADRLQRRAEDLTRAATILAGAARELRFAAGRPNDADIRFLFGGED